MRTRMFPTNATLLLGTLVGLNTLPIEFLCWKILFASASHHYPIKQRTRQTKTLELLSKEAVETIGLSWSEDTETTSLNSFRISLFATDGDLPLVPSILSVQDALNTYIFAEINAVYGWPNKVKQVNSKVLTQSTSASSRKNLRSLQATNSIITGSTLEIVVDLLFKYEPTPSISDAESKVDSIMKKDLSNLLRNLTLFASGDPELENVDSIYYLGSTQLAPNTSPNVAPTTIGSSVSDPGAIETPQENEAQKGVNIELLVPLVAGGCLLIAAAAVFTNRRRLSSNISLNNIGSVNNSTREILHTDAGINLFWDGDSDIFSVEATLVDSPNKGSKRQAHSSQHSRDKSPADDLASIDPSDIFSGIDAETGASNLTSIEESPRSGRHDTRSVFSFLSGFASRGEASTVVHSNVTKKPDTPTSNDSPEYSPRSSEAILGIRANTTSYANAGILGSEGGTPKSRISSLFTFSEEDSADLYSSGEEKESNSKTSRKQSIPGPINDEMEKESKYSGIGPSPLSTKFPETQFDQDLDEDGSGFSPANEKSEPVSVAERTRVFEHRIQSSDHQRDTPTGSTMQTVSKPTIKDDVGLTTAEAKSIPNKLEMQNHDSSDEEDASNSYACYSTGVPLKAPTPTKNTKKKWGILSPFNGNPIKAETMPTSPRSLENLQDNASLGLDDGYNTDPGPYGQHQLKSRKFVVSNRNSTNETHPWRVNLRSWKKNTPQNSPHPVPADDVQSPESFTTDEESPTGGRRGRRHTTNPTGDGTNKYQNETMGDWSLPDYTNEFDTSVNEPAIPHMDLKRRPKVNVTQIEVNASKKRNRNMGVDSASPQSQMSPSNRFSPKKINDSPARDAITPSKASPATTVSGLSGNSLSEPSEGSISKQLVSDLVWLEKKINSTTNKIVCSPRSGEPILSNDLNQSSLEHCDSLSFNSEDGASSNRSSDSNSAGNRSKRSLSKKFLPALKSPPSIKKDPIHSIICRDCYAPPGKLKIVIHSTKDGPAVHTVKKGSSLEGHIFPGDLIISVDNIDTRSYSAEQVMKMMTAKTRFERKITVLHFEEQESK